jgi:hypothetical protein
MPEILVVDGLECYLDAERLRELRRRIFNHLDKEVVLFCLTDKDFQGDGPEKAVLAGMRHRGIVEAAVSLFDVEVAFQFPGQPMPKQVISDPRLRNWARGFLAGWLYEDDPAPEDRVREGILDIAPVLVFNHGAILYHAVRIEMGSVGEGSAHSDEELKKSTILWSAYVSEGVDLADNFESSLRMKPYEA